MSAATVISPDDAVKDRDDKELQRAIIPSLQRLYRSMTHNLDPACPNPPIVCRDKEIQMVDSFVSDALQGKPTAYMLYLSGIPGTGKTTVVRHVVGKYKKSAQHDFHYHEVNGMELSQPMETFSRLWHGMQACVNEDAEIWESTVSSAAVTHETALGYVRLCIEAQQEWEQAQQAKNKRGAKKRRVDETPEPLSKTFLIVLDELDIAIGQHGPTVWFEIIDLLTRTKRFFFIGIANRQNLFEKFRLDAAHTKKIHSRLEKLMSHVFTAYSRDDIRAILLARVKPAVVTTTSKDETKTLSFRGADILGEHAIKFVAMVCQKSTHGDMRQPLLFLIKVLDDKRRHLDLVDGDDYHCLLHMVDSKDYVIANSDVQYAKGYFIEKEQKHADILTDLEALVMGCVAYELYKGTNKANGAARVEAVLQRYETLRNNMKYKKSTFEHAMQARGGVGQSSDVEQIIQRTRQNSMVCGTVCLDGSDSGGGNDDGDDEGSNGAAADDSSAHVAVNPLSFNRDEVDHLFEFSALLQSLSRLGYVTVEGPSVALHKVSANNFPTIFSESRANLKELSFLKDLMTPDSLLQ